MDLGSVLIMIGLGLAVVVFLARPLMQKHAAPIADVEVQLSVLQAERDKILAMIREIEMDRAMGKIAQEDFGSQRAALVARGSAVLREIDALGGPAGQAEMDAAIEAAVSARRAAAPGGEAGYCTRCGEKLRRGDRFCARCGAPATAETKA